MVKAEEFEMKDRGIYIPLWLPIYELEKSEYKNRMKWSEVYSIIIKK